MTKLLWLSPAFNHYKARFLNHLASCGDIEMVVLAGLGRNGKGDLEIHEDWEFNLIRENLSKADFGKSKQIRKRIKLLASNVDYIMIPAEKKNVLLLIYLLWLRFRLKSFQLISYNHPTLKSANGKIRLIDKWMTKFYYSQLDKVVFYTEESCMYPVSSGLVKSEKAFWANNTVDNTEIEKFYTYCPPPEDSFTILFIGRLIPSKQVEILLDYYSELKRILPNQNLSLEIIGDGPQSDLVTNFIDSDMVWHGTLVDEKDISPIMRRSNVVFIPGLSGLSVNHAFMYGRAYLTLPSNNHGPEINYLKPNVNGTILTGNKVDDIDLIKDLILNRDTILKWSENAFATGKQLSVQNWVKQMLKALKNG